jgi:hypothetical protein
MAFHNKRGIELSINFLVSLILAIAVFAGGLVFAGKFFSKAEQMRTSLDSQTEKQIEKLLDSGSPVVIPVNSKEIFRNKFGTFGVGVLAQSTGVYSMTVGFKNAYKPDKSMIAASADSWLQVPVTELKLTKNQKGKLLIGVTVPKGADKGTYIFDVKVTFAADSGSTPTQYDNPLQFIVKVP